MKRIDIYVSKNFIKSFLISLIAFINIFILSQLFKIIRYIGEGKMTPGEAVYYIIYLIPKILIEVTPLAILLGSLMAINKMASNLEIISLKTSGISFKRIVMFPIIIAFFISLAVFQINDKVYPKTLKLSRDIRRGTSEKIAVSKTKENAFLRADNNIVYFLGKIDRITGEANRVQIIKMNKDFNEVEKIVVAKKAKYNMEKSEWEFFDVVINDVLNKNEKELKTYSSFEYNEKPEKFITIEVDPDLLTNKELKNVIREIKTTGGDVRGYLVTLGQRYSFPFASFIVVFLGLALGSRYVRGASAISIALSVGLGYGYYIVQASFEALGNNGILNPFVSGWIPNIIFFIMGMYFMNRAEY
ncbi:MAG: LptF/LptG family permease [Cetobacterium sp.]|uniref:LptF/LptG family permease n=1 Tax=Cetobacterium sp. TaxID=2071632 RepID=UPI002FC8A1EF